MALLAKKFHVMGSDKVDRACNIYSAASDITSGKYFRARVDGVDGYVSLVPTTSKRATKGRVQNATGTYAIGETVLPTFSYKIITSNTPFTVPAGVYSLRVTCVGGGSGGCCGCSCPVTGGTTTFGSVSAAGGTAPTIGNVSATCCGGDPYSCDPCTKTDYTKVPQGYNNGVMSCYECEKPGAAAVPLILYNGIQVGSVGNGGHADARMVGDESEQCAGVTGASGFKTIQTISVTPGQVITATIGGGGNGCVNRGRCFQGTVHKSNQGCASSGGSGGILVEWGWGIETD